MLNESVVTAEEYWKVVDKLAQVQKDKLLLLTIINNCMFCREELEAFRFHELTCFTTDGGCDG